MRKIAVWVVVMVVTMTAAVGVQAQMFQTVTKEEARLVQDGPGRLYCPNCGMNLIKFYKTSHAVQPKDSPAHQYCSLHCLVEVYGEFPDGVLVVDAGSLQLISAEGAFYVVGSDVQGTMTMTSKYAFAGRDGAEAFVADHGGRIMDFGGAVAEARQGLDKETVMIDGKRAKMAAKGRRIFEKMRLGEDLPEFSSLFQAKTWAAGHEACGPLDDGQLQALAIYLVRRDAAAGSPASARPIIVPEKAKCPVCGMYVAKYPKWAALIEASEGGTFYFDGAKDLMKFYFDPGRFKVALTTDDLVRIQVTDYYTLNAIDARQAWYVVGSNVFGPMGNELIPFAAEKDAEVFLKDHSGDRILSFDRISIDLVGSLDQ